MIPELDYLAVHPEDQGPGIGTALLKQGAQKTQVAGLDIFVLLSLGGSVFTSDWFSRSLTLSLKMRLLSVVPIAIRCKLWSSRWTSNTEQ